LGADGVVEERFAVRGASEQVMTSKFTRHGPVIFEDPDRRLAYAVRTVWSEPGSPACLASHSGMRARNFDEFRDAMHRWAAASVKKV
jgi:penicillin amidase